MTIYLLQLFGLGFALWSSIQFFMVWISGEDKNIIDALMLVSWCIFVGWAALEIKDWII